jgi:hypothetical protein
VGEEGLAHMTCKNRKNLPHKNPIKVFEGTLKEKLTFKRFIEDRQKERKEEAKKEKA